MPRSNSELAELEHDTDRLRISQAAAVADARAELLAAESLRGRVSLLTNWAVDFPKATSQLLRVIARDPETSFELAAAVLGTRVMRAGPEADDTDDVLVAAFPKLRGPVRDAAADRPGVRKLVGLADGVGYEAIPLPDPSWLWPADKPFPPADTIEGVQARLNFLDLGAGPIDGEWSELTRRAFVRWQVLNGFEPNGELDEDSISRISFDGPE